MSLAIIWNLPCQKDYKVPDLFQAELLITNGGYFSVKSIVSYKLPPDCALGLVVTQENGVSYSDLTKGLRWNLTLGAWTETPDWDPAPVWKGGLLLWAWAQGDLDAPHMVKLTSLPREKNVWLAVEYPDKRHEDVVDLNSIAKVRRAKTIAVGQNRKEIADFIRIHTSQNERSFTFFEEKFVGDEDSACVGEGGVAEAGNKGRAEAGRYGKAKAGDYGDAIAGDYGYAEAGYCGNATVGNFGTAKAQSAVAGDYGKAIGRVRAGGVQASSACAGFRGHATAEGAGLAEAGVYGFAVAGNRGTAIAGEGGRAVAGDGGYVFVGDYGTAQVGEGGTAIVGKNAYVYVRKGGRASGGVGTRIRWAKGPTIIVGEDGIKPDRVYYVDMSGNVTEWKP